MEKDVERLQASTQSVQIICQGISKGRGPFCAFPFAFLSVSLSGRAASRLKFIVGHQHCNCMTNFERIAQNSCLPDEVAPNLVDGFLIGSHGMILGASAEAGGMTSRLCYDFH
jgi:hypothetical protein